MKRNVNLFTLVELIVVLSIITFLIAILLPALNMAKNQSQSTQCRTQLGQINTGLLMLTYDSDNYLPQHINDGGDWWFELINDGYINDEAFWFCPSDDENLAAYHCNKLSYGYNYRYLGQRLKLKVKITQIHTPSSVLTVGDSKELSGPRFTRCLISPSWRGSGAMHVGKRHMDGSNISFADGHSTWDTFFEIDSSNWWSVK